MKRILLALALIIFSANTLSAQITIKPVLNIVLVCWVGETCTYPDANIAASKTINAINNEWKPYTYNRLNVTGTGYGPYYLPKRAVTSLTITAFLNEVVALAGSDEWTENWPNGVPAAWVIPAGSGNSILIRNGIILVNGAKSAHEYGHLMGFYSHSHAQNYNGSASTIIDSGPFDIMGTGGYGTNINNRLTAGWVTPSMLADGTQLGTFTINQAQIQNPTYPVGINLCGGLLKLEYRQSRVLFYRVGVLQDLDLTSAVNYELKTNITYSVSYVTSGITVCSYNATVLSKTTNNAVISIQ